MGQVFKCRDSETGTPVAVKIPRALRRADESTRRRFADEIRMLERLRHPSIVRFLADGEEAGIPYYVMEWLNGVDLSEALKACYSRGGLLPFETAMPWFRQLCDALTELHAANVVHRDVKPSNVMVLTQNNSIKLIDLGIARSADDETSTAATITSKPVGTPIYSSPEQIQDPRNVDHRSDIYSAGVVFYEMLTNIKPCGVGVENPSQFNGTVPRWCDELIMQMLQRDRDRRPKNFQDIHRIIQGNMAPSKPVAVHSTPDRRAEESSAGALSANRRSLGNNTAWDSGWTYLALAIAVVVLVKLGSEFMTWVNTPPPFPTGSPTMLVRGEWRGPNGKGKEWHFKALVGECFAQSFYLYCKHEDLRLPEYMKARDRQITGDPTYSLMRLSFASDSGIKKVLGNLSGCGAELLKDGVKVHTPSIPIVSLIEPSAKVYSVTLWPLRRASRRAFSTA